MPSIPINTVRTLVRKGRRLRYAFNAEQQASLVLFMAVANSPEVEQIAERLGMERNPVYLQEARRIAVGSLSPLPSHTPRNPQPPF
ncbi:MAG: hypothetical protein AAF357_03140 [Verrucomicrobiota bacterium]